MSIKSINGSIFIESKFDGGNTIFTSVVFLLAERLQTLEVVRFSGELLLEQVCELFDPKTPNVNHGYGRNVTDYVIGAVKLEQKIQTFSDMLDYITLSCPVDACVQSGLVQNRDKIRNMNSCLIKMLHGKSDTTKHLYSVYSLLKPDTSVISNFNHWS